MSSQAMIEAVTQVCQTAQQASRRLAQLSSEQKQQALLAMAQQLAANSEQILAVNQQEVAAAKQRGLTPAFLDRMTLSATTINNMVQAMQEIAVFMDPVGRELNSWTVASGLKISRVAIPLGVIAIIYESRPNVTADAAALCLQAGNASILRGGSDCELSNKAIVDCLHRGLQQVALPTSFIQYFPTQERSAIDMLLQMDRYVDVVIPRGGLSLIKRIREQSRIPVFSHLAGICHTYIHQDAQLSMATDILVNAKMRRTGICGATETLLIDHKVAKNYLPPLVSALQQQGCEVRGCAESQAIDSRIGEVTEADWSTEYLDAIISVKVVDNIDEAIEHISHYGSNHTEAIITESDTAAQRFLQRVNSSIVMHNCSTQFADGGEFGMGAEIGIATGKLHARGPVGVEQLTTFKYCVHGQGQVRPQ